MCGDPGMRFYTTISDWHTCPDTARISAWNLCAEYMFMDDSACNLVSINLLGYDTADDPGAFDPEDFATAVRTMIPARRFSSGVASYPTEAIARNSHAFRPLGLGYAKPGALLRTRGVAYDSDQDRALAGTITALMTGPAYAQSARIARDCGGPFSGYAATCIGSAGGDTVHGWKLFWRDTSPKTLRLPDRSG